MQALCDRLQATLGKTCDDARRLAVVLLVGSLAAAGFIGLIAERVGQ